MCLIHDFNGPVVGIATTHIRNLKSRKGYLGRDKSAEGQRSNFVHHVEENKTRDINMLQMYYLEFKDQPQLTRDGEKLLQASRQPVPYS